MKVLKIIIAAITATLARLAFMGLAPYIGLPKVHVSDVLSSVYGGKEWIAGILYIISTILLSFVYVLLINPWEPVKNGVLRGMLFGLFVFLYSEANLILHLLSKHLSEAYADHFMASSVSLLIESLIFGAVLGAFFPRRQ